MTSCDTIKKIHTTLRAGAALAGIWYVPPNGISRFHIQCITDSKTAGQRLMLRGNMDAHLIGIEVTQLLLNLKAPAEKQQPPVKAGKADARTGDFRKPDSHLH